MGVWNFEYSLKWKVPNYYFFQACHVYIITEIIIHTAIYHGLKVYSTIRSVILHSIALNIRTPRI